MTKLLDWVEEHSDGIIVLSLSLALLSFTALLSVVTVFSIANECSKETHPHHEDRKTQ